MKLSKIIGGITLATILGAGVFAGVSFNKSNVIKEADADIDVNFGNSGKIFLRLDTNDWKSSSSKIGLYLFNNSVSRNAWGGLVTPSGTSKFVEYSYDLDFTPAGCIAFRVDPSVSSLGDWCWENDRGNTSIWSTTNDISFNNVVWLGNYYEYSKWTESGSYGISVTVKGGTTDDWSVASLDQQLTDVKVNGSDNLEVYGKVTFSGSTYFKVVKGSDWCGGYSAHSSIASNLETSPSGNIHVKSAATYEIYFDYEGQTSYITDPVIAAADEWAQYFLNNVNCDATSATLPSGWSACATEYGKLGDDSKDLVYGATAKEDGSYIEQAVARYDVAVARHSSLSKFIVNRSGTPRSSAVIKTPAIIGGNGNLIASIVVISITSLTAIGGYFFFRKRKEN